MRTVSHGKIGLLFIALFSSFMMSAQDLQVYDYINFEKYADDNQRLMDGKVKPSVIFMGNSITEGWSVHQPDFMSKNGYVNRGISGQTTDQMLLRFRQDVLMHEPQVVVILAGTNDLAQNSGPVPLWHTLNNIKSMAELAMANDIQVILCSVLPARAFPWRPEIKPIPLIRELNDQIRAFAKEKGLSFVDYYAAMEDGKAGLKVPEYTTAQDLVHPNAAGYAVMESLIQPAIAEALR